MKLNEEQINKLRFDCNTSFIDKNKLNDMLNEYEMLEHGSFAQCYTDFNKFVFKKYFRNPHLDSSENGMVIYGYKDVVDNLINIFKINQECSSIPLWFYVCGDELLVYKQPFMKGQKLYSLAYLDEDKALSEIKSAWNYAYYLARFYADNNITMYDLNPDNCNIYDGKLLIYDVDFYRKENAELSLTNNYEIVNGCFINFFEIYYFNYDYKISLNDYCKPSFCDEFFDEFYYKTSNRVKTLAEAKKFLKRYTAK